MIYGRSGEPVRLMFQRQVDFGTATANMKFEITLRRGITDSSAPMHVKGVEPGPVLPSHALSHTSHSSSEPPVSPPSDLYLPDDVDVDAIPRGGSLQRNAMALEAVHQLPSSSGMKVVDSQVVRESLARLETEVNGAIERERGESAVLLDVVSISAERAFCSRRQVNMPLAATHRRLARSERMLNECVGLVQQLREILSRSVVPIVGPEKLV